VVAVTSIVLKFTWYDHLKKMEMEPVAAAAPQPARG
jgi:uncharacterized protein (DUF486 family)